MRMAAGILAGLWAAAVLAQEPLAANGEAIPLDGGGIAIYAFLDGDTLHVHRRDLGTGADSAAFSFPRKSEMEEGMPAPPLEAAMAPDGRVAFVAADELYVAGPGAGEPRQLLALDAAKQPLPEDTSEEMTYAAFSDPRWAPDGKRIALNLLMFEFNQWGLVDADKGGWTPLTTPTEWSETDSVNGWELAWSPKGDAVLVASADLMNGSGLYLSEPGGLPKLGNLTKRFAGDETQFHAAAFAPEGPAFAVSFTNIEETESAVALFESPEAEPRIAPGKGLQRHLVYGPGGKTLYFWRNEAGSNGQAESHLLVALDTAALTEKTIAKLDAAPDNYDTFDTDESTRIANVAFAPGGLLGFTVLNPVGAANESRYIALDPSTGALRARSAKLPAEAVVLGFAR